MIRRYALLAMVAGISPLAVAHAEVIVTPSASLQYDSNLFRAPDDSAVVPTSDRSDTIYTAGVAVDGVMRPGNWTLKAGGTVSRNWFDKNGYLDNTSFGANFSADNGSDARIGLSLDAQGSRRLSAFSDVNSRIRNVQTFALVSGRVTVPITPDLRVVLDPRYLRNENSNSLLEQNDFEQYGAGVGVGYFSPLGNSIVAQVSREYTDGLEDRLVLFGGGTVNSPIDLVATSFDLKLRYVFSPFATIDGRLSYVSRKDHSVLGNDYSGPAGNVTLTYRPTEFTRASLSLGRRLESQNYIFIDSVRTDYVLLSGQTRVADRVDLLADGQIYRRRFTFDPLSLVDANQHETLSSVSVGARYTLLNRLELELRGGLEHRSSDLVDHDYDAKTVMFSARLPLTFFGAQQARR